MTGMLLCPLFWDIWPWSFRILTLSAKPLNLQHLTQYFQKGPAWVTASPFMNWSPGHRHGDSSRDSSTKTWAGWRQPGAGNGLFSLGTEVWDRGTQCLRDDRAESHWMQCHSWERLLRTWLLLPNLGCPDLPLSSWATLVSFVYTYIHVRVHIYNLLKVNFIFRAVLPLLKNNKDSTESSHIPHT